MPSQRCYASLSIYAKKDRESEISASLNAAPTHVAERKGTFTWSHSTLGSSDNASVEDHLRLIHETFAPVSPSLARLASEGCEIRIWIFLAFAEINRAFVVPEDFVKWMASFGADLCVDIWRNEE